MPQHDRRRLTAVVLSGFCAFLGLHAPQPLLPMLQGVFGVSTSSVSFIITVSTATIAILAPMVGILSDRWGRRNIIIPAALLLALPPALAATSATFGQLLFWRVWQGVFTPALSATSVAYITEEWQGNVGTTMAAYTAGTILGGYAGRTLAALMGAYYPWQWAFLLLGILGFAGALVIWAWLPHDRSRHVPPAPRGVSPRGVIWEHLRNPVLMATYSVGFCVLFTILAAFTYINFRLHAPPFNWSTSELGLLFTAYLAAAAFTLPSGRWMGRFGFRNTLNGSLALSMGGILLTLVRNAPVIVAGLTIFSCGIFVAQTAGNSYLGIAAKHNRAAAVGLYVTAYYIGGTFGGAIPGYFWNSGGWPACVAFIVLVQLLTGLFVSRYWREHAHAVPQVSVAQTIS